VVADVDAGRAARAATALDEGGVRSAVWVQDRAVVGGAYDPGEAPDARGPLAEFLAEIDGQLHPATGGGAGRAEETPQGAGPGTAHPDHRAPGPGWPAGRGGLGPPTH